MDTLLEDNDAVWAIALTKALLKEGHSQKELLGDTGLNSSILKADELRAPISKIAKLFENASGMIDNEVLGFEFGQASELRKGGLISYVGASSATVRHLLINMVRYRRVVGNSIDLSIDTLEETGRLNWGFRLSDTVNMRQYMEFMATGFLSDLRKLTGRNIRPKEVRFRHARNSNLKEFDRFFGCNVAFGCPTNEIIFRTSDLPLPILSADADLLKILKGYCEQILNSRDSVEASLKFKVERLISDKLVSGEATLSKVAAELGMGERTLSRKLASEGVTFRGISEGLRYALAQKYLEDSDLPIIEITYLLGFSDVSSFTTAFRGWSGFSPGRFRKITP